MEDTPRTDGLAIIYRPRGELTPHPHNARTHTRKQVQHVAKSIRTYGWTNPILIDDHQNVLAGHARLEAAKLLGIEIVPTISLSHMTPAQKRAYVIADNRMSEIAGGWDRKTLALEHEAIRLIDPEFDLSSTGFTLEDIEILFDNELTPHEDQVPALDATNPVTRIGNLWQLGEHRLLCGDALDAESFQKLLGDERAQMVITDPPYNLRVNGHISARKAS